MARPRTNPLTIDKTCPTCKKTFTLSYRKNRQIYCSRSCKNHDPEILRSMKLNQIKTFQEKYGGHPMKTEQTIKNLKSSLLKNHGDENYNNHEQTKITKLEKYGDENYNNIEQMKQTCLEKYGVKNYVFTNEYKEKSKQTCLEKYGVEFPSQSNSYHEKYKNTIFERFKLTGRFENFSPLFDINSYDGVLKNEKYPFKCDRCNQTVVCNLNSGRFPICFKCDKDNASFYQKEIYDFLKQELGDNFIILTNERTILYPKEIDIYLPDLKLAIEFNGTFWHSELSGNKNKTYHLNKLNQCLFKEIQLIHIFEYDWNNKKEIIKSILRNRIKTIKNKIYARQCIVKELDVNDCMKFLNDNHVQGKDKNNIRYGLYFNDELVSVMTFCKSRFDKRYEYEMSRFCNKLNTNVIGGASKLFSYFMNTMHPTSIVSYSDRKYFSGLLYSNLGFTFFHNTPPSYHYITNGYTKLLNRLPFQKHKLNNLLENFNPELSEWENMKNNGFDRIWDCGHSKWILKTKQSI